MSGYTTDLSWRPAAVHRRRRRPRACSRSSKPARRSCCRACTTSGCRSPATAGSSRRTSAIPRRRTPTTRRAGSQGLPVHHDTHEVISLQVAGEKRWLVYEPVLELPLKNQRYRSALGAPGEPVLDVVAARRRHDVPAARLAPPGAHVRLRLAPHHRRRQRPPLDRRGARRARRAGADDIAYRRTIDADEPPELPSLDADEVRERARDRFVRSRRPILDGQLSELRALDSAHPRTPSSNGETP